MKYLLSIIILSFSFPSYYTIGDTLNYEIHNPPMEICAGDDSGDTVFLSDYIGKIIIIGITASWWESCFWMDLEDISAYYSNDDRIVVIENLDDIGQPYSCEQWSDGLENHQIFTDDGLYYPIYDMLSIENYYAGRAIIDYNKVFRYLGIENSEVISLVDSILLDWSLGDLNGDQIINILDIIEVINIILNPSYNNAADMNQDGIVNIQDIIILIGIILEE